MQAPGGMAFPPGAYICFGDAMKRILPLLVLCLLLTGCMALPATAPAEPMYLALTFDDGPSPQYTPRLLDGLKQRGVHATFFLIGQQVQDYPELVQRIRAEGHQIGNHTYDHAPLDRLSCGEAMAGLSRCAGGNVVTMGTVELKLRDQALKRMLDIVNPTAKTVDELKKLNLPAGVDITIKTGF